MAIHDVSRTTTVCIELDIEHAEDVDAARLEDAIFAALEGFTVLPPANWPRNTKGFARVSEVTILVEPEEEPDD